MKLYQDFKKYELSPWERIVWKFNWISVSTMVFIQLGWY